MKTPPLTRMNADGGVLLVDDLIKEGFAANGRVNYWPTRLQADHDISRDGVITSTPNAIAHA